MKRYKRDKKTIFMGRFLIKKSGRVFRRRQNSRHLRRKKSKKQRRRYRQIVEVKGKMAKKIKQMAGVA
jgi:ribosomal protein L35